MDLKKDEKNGEKIGEARGRKAGEEHGRKIGEERGRKAGEEYGRKIGEEYGRKEATKEIAREMISKNMKIEDIVGVTGLTEEEIKKLK